MPRVDYRCSEHGFVELQFTLDNPPTPTQPCTICGRDMRRVFNAPGIVFKGTGFYRTDNRKSENG